MSKMPRNPKEFTIRDSQNARGKNDLKYKKMAKQEGQKYTIGFPPLYKHTGNHRLSCEGQRSSSMVSGSRK
jgi:hypothetical protein